MAADIKPRLTSNLAQVKVVGENANVSLAQITNAGETVASAVIKKVMWSGAWTVARNSVNVLKLADSGQFDFAEEGVLIDQQSDQTLTITDGSSGAGTLILVLEKRLS